MGYRSSGIPGERAASNKALSPDEVSPCGVFFQCWIGGGWKVRAENCTAGAASASPLCTRKGVRGGPGMTLGQPPDWEIEISGAQVEQS